MFMLTSVKISLPLQFILTVKNIFKFKGVYETTLR